jgi:hypothetical protein
MEPWLVPDETVRPLAEAAARQRLRTETSVPLLVERALLLEDFAARGLSARAARLDDVASTAEVEIELSEPQSAYMRVLSIGNAGRVGGHPRILPVPMRLIERLGERGLADRLDPSPLRAAVVWECAAVLSGRTMSEWAAFAMLGLEL